MDNKQKEILEKFPITRMKLLHRNLISVSEELYELCEALDSENTYTNDVNYPPPKGGGLVTSQ